LLAVLYDIHANLPALEAVLADARAAGAKAFFFGGDLVGFGPFQRETLELLDSLPETTIWIRGNGERWLREPPVDRPEVMELEAKMQTPFDEATIERLYRLPARAEVDGVVFVHGCVASDVDSFATEPQDADVLRCGGVTGRTIVFGHSHLQFRREGPQENRLVNPGSVGMPLDRDTRAAWATWDGSDFAFHRTEYDIDRAVDAAKGLGDFAPIVIKRYTTASD
jgi:diadenosine tetraphosphatase ApaH/serine/threonine PP2A family protein phosphatase